MAEAFGLVKDVVQGAGNGISGRESETTVEEGVGLVEGAIGIGEGIASSIDGVDCLGLGGSGRSDWILGDGSYHQGRNLGVVLDDVEADVEFSIGDFDDEGLVEGGIRADFGVNVGGRKDDGSFGIGVEDTAAVAREENLSELEGDFVGAVRNRKVVAESTEALGLVEGVIESACNGVSEGVDGEGKAAVEEGVLLVVGAVGCGEGAASGVDGVNDDWCSGSGRRTLACEFNNGDGVGGGIGDKTDFCSQEFVSALAGCEAHLDIECFASGEGGRDAADNFKSRVVDADASDGKVIERGVAKADGEDLFCSRGDSRNEVARLDFEGWGEVAVAIAWAVGLVGIEFGTTTTGGISRGHEDFVIEAHHAAAVATLCHGLESAPFFGGGIEEFDFGVRGDLGEAFTTSDEDFVLVVDGGGTRTWSRDVAVG